jgi:poly-gamma-glutamate capsule biosynthesis protein CapA/YwtB (metallophosphatase superfamily)
MRAVSSWSPVRFMLAPDDRRMIRRARGAVSDFRVTWAGDVLLASSARRDLRRHGYDWPFTFLRPVLGADYLVANVEGPITERTEKYFADQRWSYNAAPSSAAALARAGFHAASLSNNHCFDRGAQGLADTINHLRAVGITPFGAGPDDVSAGEPLLIPTPHGQIAVIGIGERWNYGQVAASGTPGTIPLEEGTIRSARNRAHAAGARWVVAFVHWGKNYRPVTDEQRQHARHFAAAGYDLVIGAGAHTYQPIEIIDGMPVVYSLGNFVFGTRGRFTEEAPGYGLVVRSTFDARGLARLDVTCIKTDNRQIAHRPRPCGRAEARRVLSELGPEVAAVPARISSHHRFGLPTRSLLGSVQLPRSRPRAAARRNDAVRLP